jgi:hypothetical protein
MKPAIFGVLFALAVTGCSKGPDQVVEGVMYEYGLMVTSLKSESSCASAVETVRNMRNTGRQKLRDLLKTYGKMCDEDRQKVSAGVSKQAGALNAEYFKPFKSRCPAEAAKVAAEMDAVLLRFKASLAPY